VKRSLAGLLIVTALSASGSAFAADIPPPAPPPAAQLQWPSAPYDWTGFYVGINGGGVWGQSDQTQIPASTTSGSFGVSGGLVGGTVGFNFQIDRLVLGLEGDLDWAHIGGTAPCRLSAFTCSTDSNYLATVRARLGFAWPDHWLTYVTGGGAAGNVIQGFSPAVGSNNGTTSNNIGWTVGGGIQYALANTWAGTWSIKFEYLYVDLGTFNCTIACSGVAGQTTNTTLDENIFRTGIDYRF
jgi:outer membrane immunogenic protein